MIFRTLFASLLLAGAHIAMAADRLSNAEATEAVAKSVDRYAAAIACETEPVRATDIVALVPYAFDEDSSLSSGIYAAIWVGDIGCEGGSATITAHIAIVTIGFNGYFQVDPKRSSPQVEFAPILTDTLHSIVSIAADTIVLQGFTPSWTMDDAKPGDDPVMVQLTMKQGLDGDWTLVQRRRVERFK